MQNVLANWPTVTTLSIYCSTRGGPPHRPLNQYLVNTQFVQTTWLIYSLLTLSVVQKKYQTSSKAKPEQATLCSLNAQQ